jgi:hypothetical protein
MIQIHHGEQATIIIPGTFLSISPDKDQEVMEHYIKAAKPGYISGRFCVSIFWYFDDANRPIDEIAQARGALLRALKSRHVVRGFTRELMSGPAPISECFIEDKHNPRIEVKITSHA